MAVGGEIKRVDSILGPVIIDIAGTKLEPADRDLLRHPLVGGLIFFSRNYQSRQQLSELVAEIRAVRPNLLLAVDQEGGRVQRFKQDFTLIPPMQAFWRSQPEDIQPILPLVKDCGWLLAAEVLASGVDISFAPVLDVDDCQCAIIADRSFAPKPYQAAELAAAFIAGMHEAGMAVTGKHFPGHGGVTEDSHIGLPVDQRDYVALQGHDLVPFTHLAPLLNGVMPAHVVFPAIDSVAVGFSQIWLQDKLRRELGFAGVIFSDDLSMAGAHSAGNYGERAEKALAAGCDAVLVCNSRAGAEEVLQGLSRGNVEPNNRLALMRAQKTSDWLALEQSPRWHQTRTALASLVQSAPR